MIRRADQGDAEGCLAVYAPYVTDTAYTFETEVPPAEEMARRIGAAKLWLVAERDGQVAGFAYGGTHRSRAAYRWTVENRALIGMAVPQFAIDPRRTPRLRLLVDQADVSADVLRPILQNASVALQAYRKVRWGDRTGLLLEAA